MKSPENKTSLLWKIASVFWNGGERRPRALWRMVGLVVLVAVISVISQVMLSLFVSPDYVPASFSGQIQLNIVFVVAVWLAVRFLDRRKFSETGIQSGKNWWLDFGFGLALGAILMTAIFLIEMAAGWLTVIETFKIAESGPSFALSILIPAAFFLTVGIAEELVFRGYFLLNIAEGFNLKRINPRNALIAAWVLTSAIFAVAHAANPNATVVSTANILMAGLWFGLPYVLTGSLAISIGTHITWNFFQGNVFGFPVSGTTFFPTTFVAIEQSGPSAWTGGLFGPEGGLLGLFGFVVGAVLTVLWLRVRYGRLAFVETIPNPPPSVGNGTSEPH
jgi:membrane protease YdiL (CAAX protease family)